MNEQKIIEALAAEITRASAARDEDRAGKLADLHGRRHFADETATRPGHAMKRRADTRPRPTTRSASGASQRVQPPLGARSSHITSSGTGLAARPSKPH